MEVISSDNIVEVTFKLYPKKTITEDGVQYVKSLLMPLIKKLESCNSLLQIRSWINSLSDNSDEVVSVSTRCHQIINTKIRKNHYIINSSSPQRTAVKYAKDLLATYLLTGIIVSANMFKNISSLKVIDVDNLLHGIQNNKQFGPIFM